MSNDVREYTYIPYPVPLRFHQGLQYFVRAISGPFGSGKSVTCVNELLYISMRQAPNSRGERKTRHGVIRASYPMLRTTTKLTMEKWLPEEFGEIKETAPMEGEYRIPLNDGTVCIIHFILIAIELEKDIQKLRSTDFTAIWINEANEIGKSVLDNATGRVGRYPTGMDGICTWAGVIMDYNKPPEGHWLDTYMLDGNRPGNTQYYEQPPAAFKRISDLGEVSYEINENADNLHNLGIGGTLEGGIAYYRNQIDVRMASGDFTEIDQLFCMERVLAKHGKPVWPEFTRERHVVTGIKPIPGVPTIGGIDTSGVHPAAVIAQMIDGRWIILDELYGESTGMKEFVETAILPVLNTRYPGVDVVFRADPADSRNSHTALTATQILQEYGINATVAPTNNIRTRIEAVGQLLNMYLGGLVVSSSCKMAISSMGGGYVYKKSNIQGSFEAVVTPIPLKNKHSHIADAIQYLALHIQMDNDMSGVRSVVKEKMKHRTRNRRRS